MATKRQTRRRSRAHLAQQKRPAAAPVEQPPEVAQPEPPRDEPDVATTPGLLARLVEHRRFPVAALVGIFAISWAVWAWVGSRHLFPNLFPDEVYYAKL